MLVTPGGQELADRRMPVTPGDYIGIIARGPSGELAGRRMLVTPGVEF